MDTQINVQRLIQCNQFYLEANNDCIDKGNHGTLHF